MRLPPLEIILTWPTPDYIDPPTRGDALLIVNSIFITLVIVTVSLRLYTRLAIKRWFGLDDVFILLALVFTIGLTAVVLLANQSYGWDRHVWDIPFDRLEATSKIAMAAKLTFTAAATFTRLSLLCFYYRLVSDSGKQWFKWLIHINVAYNVFIFIGFICLAVFLCNPIQNYWIIGAPADTCLDEGKATLAAGIINCVADFLTTVTPMPLVFRLMMPARQRMAVAVLFGLGIIVTIAGIIRTWYIYQSLIKSYDQTWAGYPLWIAAAIEIDLGVICASAPVLKPLLAKLPSALSSTFTRTTSSKARGDYAVSKDATLVHPGTISSSTRRSEPLKSAPELAPDQGRSYQLKHWADIEPGLRSDGTSEEAIFEEHEDTGAGHEGMGLKKLWKRMTWMGGLSTSPPGNNNELTITRTSEVDVIIEEAGAKRDRRTLRFSSAHEGRI